MEYANDILKLEMKACQKYSTIAWKESLLTLLIIYIMNGTIYLPVKYGFDLYSQSLYADIELLCLQNRIIGF